MIRSIAWLTAFVLALSLAFPLLAANEGQEDLDAATEAKLNASTLSDLDEVIRLSESALKKGLDEGNSQFANGLLASTLVQRGTVRAALAARTNPADPRFDDFRKAAMDDLDKAVKIDPKQSQAWLMIAQLSRLPGGSVEKSNKALDQALESVGDDPELKAKVLLTRAAVTQDEKQKLADLDEAIRLAPGDPNGWRSRGLLKADQGKAEEALADLEKATELDPDHGPTLEVKAIVLTRLKRFDEALRALEQTQKLHPDSLAPLIQKARVHAAKADMKAAIEEIQRAKKLDPGNMSLFLLHASLEEDPARKIAVLDEAIAAAPTNTLALRSRGLLKAEQEKYDEALADLDKAIELQPKEQANYEAKGLVLSKAKRFDEALAVADQLIALDPDDSEGKRFRAGLLAEAGKFDEAVAALEKLIEADPKDLSVSLALAMLYQSKKKSEKAIEVFAAIIQREPEFTPAWRGRGDALLNIGKHAEAIADYERALKLTPHDSGVLNNFAWVLATSPVDALRDGQRAIKLATEACELTDYQMPHILSTLAAAYAEAGDFDNAIKWVTKGLETAGEKEKEPLTKELEHYKQKKPFRELLNESEEKP
jgi:tetratricopeptide (TPR) repeat protein